MSFFVYCKQNTMFSRVLPRPAILDEERKTYEEWRAAGRYVMCGQRSCGRRWSDQMPLFAKSQTRPRVLHCTQTDVEEMWEALAGFPDLH